MKQTLTRYLLLQKRLVKRKSYICMTLFVFLFVIALRGIASGDGSMVTVAVFASEDRDGIANDLLNGLGKGSDIVSYVYYDDIDEAIGAVERGDADEAWIIPDDMERVVKEFARDNNVKEPIEVYARETNVLHYFLREILESRVFRPVSRQILNDYVAENIGEAEADLDRYLPEEGIFRFYDMEDRTESETIDYVVAPLRGLMAIWLIISAIASVMYYIYDEKNGLFVFWKTDNVFLREYLYHLLIILASSVTALIGLLLGGVFTSFIRELVTVLFYDAILAFFAIALRTLLNSEIRVGVFTPVVITVSAVFSPVFVDLRSFKVIQVLVPAFHYLKSMFDSYYYRGMAVYCVCVFLAALCFYYLRRLFDRAD